MCNLNILIRRLPKDNIDRELAFMQTVTTLSYDTNSDADGIFFSDGHITKSSSKLDLISMKEHFKSSNCILSHQRIATSGKSEQYHQPFMSDEFAFMHNGVVSSFASNDKSDTHNMFNSFLRYFNGKKPSKSRVSRIERSIKQLCKKMLGSYSIALYDRVENKLYYFKETCTKITLFKSDDYLYFSTASNREDFLSLLSESTFVEIKLDANKLYQIELGKNDNKDVYEIATLPERGYTQIKTPVKPLTKKDADIFDKYPEYERPSDEEDWNRCLLCWNYTTNAADKDGYYYCKSCVEKYEELKQAETKKKEEKRIEDYADV